MATSPLNILLFVSKICPKNRSIFQIELWKPSCCDPELWSLLEECWSREEQLRPSFAQVDLFFRRRAKVLLSQQQHKNNFGVQV